MSKVKFGSRIAISGIKQGVIIGIFFPFIVRIAELLTSDPVPDVVGIKQSFAFFNSL